MDSVRPSSIQSVESPKVLNLFVGTKTNICHPGFLVKLNALERHDKIARRSISQSISNSYCRNGLDSAPLSLFDHDIAVLTVDKSLLAQMLQKYARYNPEIISAEKLPVSIVKHALSNKIRVKLENMGFRKLGSKYVKERDIIENKSQYKEAFDLQTDIIENCPAVWIDQSTRIIQPFDSQAIDSQVRILPTLNLGIYKGKSGKRADDEEFDLNGVKVKCSQYWKLKHGINFVKPDEELFLVYVPAFGKTLTYPKSCIFKEYTASALPEFLKKSPAERVSFGINLVNSYPNTITFLGKRLDFRGPVAPQQFNFSEHSLGRLNETLVQAGGKNIATIDRVYSALKSHGPYTGQRNGKFIVIYHGDKQRVEKAIQQIVDAYSGMKFGRLELLRDAGDGGYIDTSGDDVASYSSTISMLRTKMIATRERILAFLVLPYKRDGDHYYKSRSKLYERLFGKDGFPCQALTRTTVDKILANAPGTNAIVANLVSQCYVKYGGIGTAPWILNEPADSAIDSIIPGSSCYAYHDVSRRVELKSAATVYSAMTDSYGRYIATGHRPAGGERVSPQVFYDIILGIIDTITKYSVIFSQNEGNNKFVFGRLVYAKDGIIHNDEAEMMENVIRNGLQNEGKLPIPTILKNNTFYPQNLVIDIIGVNKSPKKRIISHSQGVYSNVPEGTAIIFDKNHGILVSYFSRLGTSQPIEISLKKHICMNCEVAPPSISQIIEEYYRLTRLNWASVLRQGKYALPQILTQNLGENISAGIPTPDNTILL